MALMPVADALAAILAGAEPMPEEMVALEAAHHRVLARDVAARRTQPPQAMSAMDGYAVRAADAAKVQTRLRVIGEVAAGRPFDRAIGPGEAARIFTGADGFVERPAGRDLANHFELRRRARGIGGAHRIAVHRRHRLRRLGAQGGEVARQHPVVRRVKRDHFLR